MKILEKPVYICDIEADGLLDTITKIYCLGMAYEKNDGSWDVKVTQSKEGIKSILEKDCIIVGHNFIDYDIPAIKKIYPDIEVKATIWDSLFFSYGLFVDSRMRHGLDSWGDTVGIKKVKVADEEWKQGNIDLMIDRVSEDCKINTGMFILFMRRIKELYQHDTDTMYKHINYLNFLAKKANAQLTQTPFSVDIEAAEELLNKLEIELEKYMSDIQSVMPKVLIIKTKNKPAKLYKKDSTLSKRGKEWLEFLKHCNLPEDHEEPVDYISGHEEPNAGSPDQIKKWLLFEGWKPDNFETRVSKVTGISKEVPQVRIEVDGEKVLCPSVLKLSEKIPQIKSLERVGLLRHRIGLIKGKSGLLVANSGPNHEIRQRVKSLANTYRYKHGILVNIPKQKEYGKDIRRCLVAPLGHKLVSGDIKALEDTTKLISVKPIDPGYVEKFSDPAYDAHLDISVQGQVMTQEQADEYSRIKKKIKVFNNLVKQLTTGEVTNEYFNAHKDEATEKEDKLYFDLTTLRGLGKRANFSCTYGAYPKKIASIIDKPIKVAKGLWEAYWKINWSIKAFAESLTVKTISDGSMWLKSDLSGFWLSLRSEKDRFSLHNQNMGRFCFDTYTAYMYRLTGYYPIYDQHDDAVYIVPEDKAQWLADKMKIAMAMVNQKFKLVIPLQIEPAIGDNLSEV